MQNFVVEENFQIALLQSFLTLMAALVVFPMTRVVSGMFMNLKILMYRFLSFLLCLCKNQY